ncbi:hypothetical protein [Fictibacillus barbaricus]|jgi:hypothetical protein|uniref:Uncharacterized protein n=1 Tax=Fictibacillus barbaricus TaxID=182136 RepID=A0ABS2ZG53_9BACL|nr:hypothetical protein [Fictibacillus barbaricus]MBN3545606.1 hypothetical protein [Fictibacillus barbaricus]GGB54746.1 hypothetical protein GCM10007199_20630 [Fictibacillus barbaricus]
MSVQFLFEVQSVLPGERTDEKIVLVSTELLYKSSGETIFTGIIPVRVSDHGVFVSVAAISAAFTSKYLRTETLFRLKRYIKKMRDYLDLDNKE